MIPNLIRKILFPCFFILGFIPIIFLTLFLSFATSWAETYYVAINGSDANPGTLDKPFATITKGASILAAGDALYVRGGTYSQTVYVYKSGTIDAPITISGYPGETTVVDGQDTLPTADWAALFLVEGNWVVVRDIKIQNSNWMGLKLGGSHNQAINVKSYANKENGILATGDYSLVENCEVYYNCRSNEFGKKARGDWASGLSAARHPQYAVLRNNKVWNNWGEGLSTYEAQYTTIEDNIVFDNWSANVYLSDTKYTVCRRNLVYSTPGNPCNSGSQVGIAMGDEQYNPSSSDNSVINNFVSGNRVNLYWWPGVSGGGLVNTLIAYNTLVNSVQETNLKILNGTHINTRIENNLTEQSDSLPVASIYGNTSGLFFSYNLWSKTPPNGVSGPGDVIGDPKLAKTGPTGSGALTSEWFKILVSSPARDRAKVITDVTEDFFGTSRGAYPDMGAYELPSQLVPPTNLKIIP